LSVTERLSGHVGQVLGTTSIRGSPALKWLPPAAQWDPHHEDSAPRRPASGQSDYEFALELILDGLMADG